MPTFAQHPTKHSPTAGSGFTSAGPARGSAKFEDPTAHLGEERHSDGTGVCFIRKL
jgi:hypothetical protein